MPAPIYIAIAYRYGWLNGHWYILAASTVRETAEAYAQSECFGRGGKYGIEVVEMIEGQDDKRVAYFPSAWGEKEPTGNQRICLEHSFGTRLLSDIEERERKGEDVPKWIIDVLETERGIAKAFYPDKAQG